MNDGPPVSTEPSATTEVAEPGTATRASVCSTCRKLPVCFGRLFCPTRDLV